MAKRPQTLAQKLALADFRALRGMTAAERGVQPWELTGEQPVRGNPTSIRPYSYWDGEITTKGRRPRGLGDIPADSDSMDYERLKARDQVRRPR